MQGRAGIAVEEVEAQLAIARPLGRVRRVSVPAALAGIGVLLAAYQAYTLLGWIADGPHQITADRAHGTTSWVAARVIEVLVVASVAGFIAHAARERRRMGRLGTDALLIIGMFSAGFWDPIYNWVAPAWLYSSNFLNVNDWLAHAPGVSNPIMGSQPWPIVIVLIGYPLWGVGFAMLINVVMVRAGGGVRRRLLTGLVAAVAITCASFGIFKALDLMSAPGFRFSVLGNSDVLFAGVSGGLVFWGLACVRHFTGADGRAFFDRPGDGVATSVLAAMATCQLLVVLGWGVLTVPFTTHSSPYPALPAHLVNGECDPPGLHGTAYGPCPGSAR